MTKWLVLVALICYLAMAIMLTQAWGESLTHVRP